jgi:hypothetical protein
VQKWWIGVLEIFIVAAEYEDEDYFRASVKPVLEVPNVAL